MAEEKYPRVNFRLGEGLLQSLTARIEQDQALDRIAKRDLERYYTLLSRSLPSFSEQEALLLCRVLNGSKNAPESIHRLWVEVQEALEEYPYEGVHSEAFVARLKALSPMECMAVADAAERYWVGPYHQEDSKKRLREVGLTK